MFDKFKKHVNTNFQFLKQAKLLIAISGGIDSVVLAYLCNYLNLNFSLAHCNFNLRGEESDADETFILELAENMKVEVFIESFDTKNYAVENKLSIQMAARELRYNWFKELAEQLKYDYILTGHQADDNLETFLINLSRGTGLEGLTAIPEINDNIVRPVLQFSREEIEAYAKDNNLKWREDSSNVSTQYLRNKLRLDVIPKLKEINPQFLQNFNKTQGFLKDSRAIIYDSMDNVSEDVIVDVNENEIYFSISKIKRLSNPKAYLYELLNDYGFTEWNDVLNLLNAQSGKQIFSKTHRLLKNRSVLILTKLSLKVPSDVDEKLFIDEGINEVELPFGRLTLGSTKQLSKPNKSTIHIDKDLLKFPLIVRKWEEGDYFYPFGMKGKKKLSKYFKDEKLSLLAKENIWVLCSENNVVWVVKHRFDDRYRVTGDTKNILKISIFE